MGVPMFPGISNPTTNDLLGLELAEEQVNFIHELRAIRLKHEMSVSAVAELMGVDAAQVSRLESGSTNPTMSTIRRYAQAIGAIFRIKSEPWHVEKARRVEDAASTVQVMQFLTSIPADAQHQLRPVKPSLPETAPTTSGWVRSSARAS
ncbi:helix-turn-helix domain-containing protein [Nocardia sp. NPDC057455]|uniref:helix-turn-helix domain-containing protein n=1 Tax=Nocardia sp. NPDC057455 TaxID=3346138 RepID=UPI00366F2677